MIRRRDKSGFAKLRAFAAEMEWRDRAGIAMGCKTLIALALVAGAVQVSRAQTRQEPLWEYGLGIGAIAFQDYPGSDTSHVYPIPVAYLLYNGTFLRADRTSVLFQAGSEIARRSGALPKSALLAWLGEHGLGQRAA